jgi:hypothetical protein
MRPWVQNLMPQKKKPSNSNWGFTQKYFCLSPWHIHPCNFCLWESGLLYNGIFQLAWICFWWLLPWHTTGTAGLSYADRKGNPGGLCGLVIYLIHSTNTEYSLFCLTLWEILGCKSERDHLWPPGTGRPSTNNYVVIWKNCNNTLNNFEFHLCARGCSELRI